MVCKRSRLGTALLRIAMPAPAFYAVVTMLFTAQFVGLAGQAVAAEFIGVAAAMRGDVIRVSSASSEIPSGATTRNDSTIRQYDYKRSDVSLTVNYRLTD